MAEFYLVAASFLAGSIPFALLLGFLRGVDIRAIGSGNTGATNLGRTLGLSWGIAAFVLDFLKGFAPAWFAANLEPGWATVGCGAAAVAGHVWSPWLRFRGGKGVATAAGVFAALAPWACLAAFVAWAAALGLTRTMSVASILAALVLPVAAAFTSPRGAPREAVVGLAAGLAVLVVLRHRENIRRLREGKELKLGEGGGR